MTDIRIIEYEEGVTGGTPQQGMSYFNRNTSDPYGRNTTTFNYIDQLSGGIKRYPNDNRIEKISTEWSRRKAPAVIIPGYVYPSSVFTNPTWNATIDLIKTYNDVQVYVILNPSSGPGTVTDGNYLALIKRLQGAGATVLGYVASGYVAVDIDTVKADISKWLELYPRVDGIFIDEMTNDADDSHVTYYKDLTDHSHNLDLYPVIGNPGADQLERYFETRTTDVIVVHENSTVPLEATLKGDFDGGHMDYDVQKRAALVYGQSSLDLDLLGLVSKYTGYVYITDDILPNPWDTISPYLEETLQYLSPGYTSRTKRSKSYDIGDWNMVSTASISLDISADFPDIAAMDKIYKVYVYVRDDNGFKKYPIDFDSSGSVYWDTNTQTIELARVAGKTFDDILFDSTSYNRGEVIVEYNV